ncbi:MAG: hypothetical protein JW932_05090 [Deltaproteobacteria bacterium]|nr:hypothetical protein [Deltaproteobacteria bacterium]
MNTIKVAFNFSDNGGRRIGIERRQFTYSSHIPERRRLKERRSHTERRMMDDRRKEEDRRTGLDRRNLSEQPVIVDLRGYERRNSSDRRSGIDRRDFVIL